jgi:predicted phosphoadenosine phosphosulfate sulfurtransferase
MIPDGHTKFGKNKIPRVVSFSGGRTSAMMLLQLLKKGDCSP